MASWKMMEIKYLKQRYRLVGDVELAKRMTEIFERPFTKLMVDSKMRNLNLKRSCEEIKRIRTRNMTGPNNPNKNARKLHQIGEITIRTEHNKGGKKTKWIKISDGEYQQLSRFNWEGEFGPVPEGHIIIFKDGNSMNCEVDNLKCLSLVDIISKNKNREKFSQTYKQKANDSLLKSKELLSEIKKKREQCAKLELFWADLNNSEKYTQNSFKTNEYHDTKKSIETLKKEISTLKVTAFRLLPIQSRHLDNKKVTELHRLIIEI